ncbi:MAG: alpha/beta hydrolase [Rhodospirillaceae bacterium]|jgi:uncharacterized protein|nr:alpha/beta hydrolase [Rhodospirillaceae bacterium]
MNKRLFRRVINLLLVLAGIYGLIVAGMYFGQRKLMYVAGDERPFRSAYGAEDAEAVSLRTADGLELLAWYWPALSEDGFTVVYLHGNAGHIGNRVEKARPYLAAGLGALLVEWRGYAGNPGSPTEEGFAADARAALAFLEGRGIRDGRMLLYGESIGSGPAVRLAVERAAENRTVGAVVLEAPFTSAAAVAQAHYPWLPAYWLVRDRHDSLAWIDRIGAPLLILHGALDRVVPARMGRALHEAALEPKRIRIWPEAGHNDLYEHGAAETVLDFLAAL